MILYGRSDEVAAFVAANIPGCERGFGPCQAVGFLDDEGQLEAGVVYHNWSPETQVIEISAASAHRNWTSRERVRAIFSYPFDDLGCRIVIARIGEHNVRARRIWRSLGADEYRIPALRSPTEAEMIYTLRAEVWRAGKFSGVPNGKTIRSKAS